MPDIKTNIKYKIISIYRCLECPYFEKYSGYCFKLKQKVNYYPIPKNCPLPDYKEQK